MWRQWTNCNFTKLREYFLSARKTKITTLFNNSSPPHPVYCCAAEGLGALGFHQKYLNLCSEDEQRFGTKWGWVINNIIFIFGWTIPLRRAEQCWWPEHWSYDRASGEVTRHACGQVVTWQSGLFVSETKVQQKTWAQHQQTDVSNQCEGSVCDR